MKLAKPGTIPIALLALLVAAATGLAPAGPDQDPRPSSRKAGTRPVDVFRELDGHWIGTFVGYDVQGKELYRIRVEQWYRTIDASTQEVRIRDTMPDGKVITGKGRNMATRGQDGRLQLACIVEKSNGEKVEHQGRLVRGPGGQEQIVWFHDGKERSETFREWVVPGPSKTYHIHGMGSYGGTRMLMAGRYRQVLGDGERR